MFSHKRILKKKKFLKASEFPVCVRKSFSERAIEPKAHPQNGIQAIDRMPVLQSRTITVII